MSYQQLYNRYREAKQGMFAARNPHERAIWLAVYYWTCQEIRCYNASTLSTQA